DGHGNVGSQPLVITITGTAESENDVPVIVGATNPDPAVVEVAGDSHLQDIPQQDGTISITDQDLGDTLTVTVKGDATASYNGGDVPDEDSVNVAALIASGAITFDLATSNGEERIIGWHYNPAVADLDWLRKDATLTITYLAQVIDGVTPVGPTQALTITITGTNDAPVFTGVTNPAPISEFLGDSHAQDIPQVNGDIRVTDQDLGDPLTVTVTGNATATYTLLGGVPTAVPVEDSVDITALVASGAITFDLATSNGEERIIGWHYNPAVADLDWLRKDATLTITYLAQVTDGVTPVGPTQALTITITGTNDAPVFTGVTNPAPISEVLGDSHAQDIPQVNGDIRVTDQDLGDPLTVTVTGNATATYTLLGGVPTAVPVENSVDITALVASGAITFDAATSNGETVIIGWHYNPEAADLDWLRDQATLTITFIAHVTDGVSGNVVDQPLTITITGTEDVPVF